MICGIVALAQLITLYLGHFLSSLFCRYRSVPDEKLLGQIISMVIFMILGIRLMVKAIRNEHVEEHLEHHLGIRRFVRMACISGIYTLLTGIAFGFLETNVLMILIMIVVCTVAFVIGGIYTGYRVGYEAKTKVYIVGALLLWVAGLDVLFGRIFIKSVIVEEKPAIFWLVFFSYMCIINMYESVRQVHKMDYTVLDLEMTGLAPKRDKVIEIGAVRVRNGEIADTYGTLVRPGMSIPETVVQLTGITDEMAALGKEENVAMQELLQFIGDDILVGHNLIFDYSFLKQWAVNQKIPLELSACDTLRIARALLPGAQSKKLESLCEYFQIEREHAHRALDDAVETYKVFENLKSIEGASMELFVPKPLVYKAKRQTPATEHQKERLRELMEQYGRKDSISWETLTRSEASRLQDKIRAGNF